MTCRAEEFTASLTALFEGTTAGVLVMDPSGTVLAANRALVGLLGSRDEAMTRSFNIFDLPTLPPDVKAAFRRVVEGGHRESMRVTYRSMHGRVVEGDLELMPVQGPDRSLLVAVIRDMTELVQAQEAVRRSSKMETLNILAAGLAHDLNNIFGAVVGYASMLRELEPANERHRRLLGNMIEAAGSGAELVERLLGFTSERLADQTSCDIARSIRRVEGLLSSYLKGDIDATVSLPTELPPVRGSSTRLEQALANLLVNARDAVMLKGRGSIQVLARQTDQLPASMVLQPVPSALGWVEVRVEDDGVGIDAPDPAAVFEPYFTTKPIGRGTGLGLSIVYGVMKAIRGGIAVRSTPGRGAEFSLFFPVVSEPWKEDTVTVSSPLSGEGRRVLILERDQGIREFCTWAFLRNDYKALSVATPQDALTMLGEHHRDLALFVSEAELEPPELLKLVGLARTLGIPMLAMTSGGRQATIPGAAGLLGKPFDEQALLAAAGRILGRS